MHKTDGVHNVAGEFVDEIIGTSQGTVVEEGWLNTVQRELVNVVEGAGIVLDSGNDAQVLEALKRLQCLVLPVNGDDYICLDDDGYTHINVTAGAANRTITLPTAADNIGRRLKIRKVDNGAGYVITDGEGAETINGITEWRLFNQYDYVVIECDGTEWFVTGGTEPELVYRHTADFSQAAAQNIWYAVTNFILALPTGGNWEIEINATFGSATAATIVELTVADGAASEDDDIYTMKLYLTGAVLYIPLSKTFRRTFSGPVTLHVNMRTISAGTPNILLYSATAHAYIRAKRIR